MKVRLHSLVAPKPLTLDVTEGFVELVRGELADMVAKKEPTSPTKRGQQGATANPAPSKKAKVAVGVAPHLFN